jgi:hypothetical protein
LYLTSAAAAAAAAAHRLTGQAHDASFLRSSVILRAHDAALRTLPGTASVGAASGVVVRGNVFFESYDTSTVVVDGHHAVLEGNLALGTIKDTSGERLYNSMYNILAVYKLASSHCCSGPCMPGSTQGLHTCTKEAELPWLAP